MITKEEMLEMEQEAKDAAKEYANQYKGLLFSIGGVGGLSAIEMGFMRGLQFGLDQALYIKSKNEMPKEEG